MAEAVLSHVAGEIVMKMFSQSFKEIGLWWGVEEELENLENTVSSIQAVLLDAEEQQEQNHQFRDWLRKLKYAVYDADDLLDDFYTEASRQGVMTGSKMTKKVRVFFSSSNQLVYGLQMGHKIKTIRERLDRIAADRLNFHFKARQVEKHVEDREWKKTDSFVDDEKVIGRGDDKQKIIDLLLESNVKENVSVVPIVGIGGLGKTTLAQVVFNDETVKAYFELKMWVCVSDDFNVQIIAKNILESISKNKPKNDEKKSESTSENKSEYDEKKLKSTSENKSENDESASKKKPEMDTLSNLRNTIDGKKYLLVLDDVWNEHREKWNNLQNLLVGGARGSKIVITTRKKMVAEITGAVPPYELKGLSVDESWSLLKKTAFKGQGQESNNSKLEEIGREIAKKCKGVPLAVKTIGRVLYFKTTELEWSNVMKNELATITQQEYDILPILKLSYDHLPSHLKNCFAYCSLFPKDYVIDKQTLINLWVAQGFIQSSTGEQQLEDVGHEYFKDLVWRSFFQEVQEDEVGNVKSCKMHGLMHDLARLVAGIECTLVNLGTGNIDKRARHVSFGYKLDSSWKIPVTLLEANKIRTYFLPAQSYGELKKSDCNTIVSICKCLRALDLHSSNIKRVPHSIGKLKHLRYLDLSKNEEIRKLPNSISRLHNLQTLKLSGCWELVELPSDIRKLVSLRHLIIDGCYGLTRMPKGLGQLTCLRTLSLFVVGKRYSLACRGSGGLGELNGLNNLEGELRIKKLQNATSAEVSDAKYLKEKHYLQSLKLEWSYQRSERDPCSDDEVMLDGLQPHPNLKKLHVDGFWGVRFSDWLSSLTNIVEIKLEDCRRCQHLPPLDQLPSLKILDLRYMSDLECITSEESSTSRTTTFFPSLKELYFEYCYNLKGWWKNDDDSTTTTSMAKLPSFPCLSKLQIWCCPMLNSMPLYPSLEEELSLMITSSTPLQQTMKMKMEMMKSLTTASPSTSSSSSSSYPLSRLKSLSIGDINDLESLPEECLQNLTSLRSLTISSCPRLMSLPGEGFRGLTSLRSLQIEYCNSLKSLFGVFQHLTALEKLVIRYCEELDLSSNDMQWQYLKSLSSLSIGGLPQLVSLSEGLQHLTALAELNIQECKQLDLSDSGIRFNHSLRTLTLSSIRKLVSLPDWLQHLTALEELYIRECKELDLLDSGFQFNHSLRTLTLRSIPKLVSLPDWLQHLTALEELKIQECKELDLSDSGFRFNHSLRTLSLGSIPKLVSLPDWLQHVTTLQKFEIEDCPNFTTLPEWIGNLTSLQELSIYSCPKLTSLPQGMQQLTTLQSLTIYDCPPLSKRCRNSMGKDWPKISHIPTIKIGYQAVQREGSYQLRHGGILQCFNSGQ